MARTNSFIKLEGTLDGLTFYKKNGETLVKTQSKVSRNRIMNDPAYKRTRENMKEFAGAAKLGKAFREAFAGVSKLMGDTYMGSRVNGIMKRIGANGSGMRGERDFDVVDYTELLKGFEFNTNTPFDTQFFAPYGLPTINANRDTATWDVPDFSTDTYVRAPEGATHFKLVLAAGFVSNYAYVAALKGFEPVDDALNGQGGVAYSAAIPLGGMVGAVTSISVDLSALGAVPVTTAFMVGTGIIFYQEVNGALYVLAQGNGLKVATAG